MRLPAPPVRMLSNNLPQAVVIYTLQMYRVFVQIAMGLSYTWGDMPITGDFYTVTTEKTYACQICIFLFNAGAAGKGGNPRHCEKVFFNMRLYIAFCLVSIVEKKKLAYTGRGD